ncbi:hypothetical protein RDABS01_004233 [Bienertia sinuspersici]
MTIGAHSSGKHHLWKCLSRQCKGVNLDVYASVTYESSCRVLVELAIPCEKRGPRVFEGFTIGFHPRSWEIVYNGMTQLGFEKSHNEFSFSTEQTRVTLYMTAIASLSTLVQKPIVKWQLLWCILKMAWKSVYLALVLLETLQQLYHQPFDLDWTCTEAHTTPYEVEITIPVENYEPVNFTLTKMCGKTFCMVVVLKLGAISHSLNMTNFVVQIKYFQATGKMLGRSNKRMGHIWNHIFNVCYLIFFVSLTLFCCGGFIYKSRTQNQHGLDALPGMTYLSALLQTVTGGGHGYQRAEESNNPFMPAAQGTGRRNEVRYGSI